MEKKTENPCPSQAKKGEKKQKGGEIKTPSHPMQLRSKAQALPPVSFAEVVEELLTPKNTNAVVDRSSMVVSDASMQTDSIKKKHFGSQADVEIPYPEPTIIVIERGFFDDAVYVGCRNTTIFAFCLGILVGTLLNKK